MIQHRIHDVIQQEQDSLILKSSKLDFFQALFNVGTRAHYVDILNNRNNRSMYAKMKVITRELARQIQWAN